MTGFQEGQPIPVEQADGSRRPGSFVGDAQTQSWFGGQSGAYVVYADTHSGEEVSLIPSHRARMTRSPMRLDLGSPVRCTDDAVGELADVVIDPQTRRVTHLVVQPHHRDEEARLVPIDRAQAGEASDATISLSCTVAQMSEFELVREAAYLRLGEVPAEDPDWDVGIEEPLGLPPSPGMDAFGVGGVDIDPHVMLTYDRVPMGEVEIRRASSVTWRTGITSAMSTGSSSTASSRSPTSCSSTAISGGGGRSSSRRARSPAWRPTRSR